MVVVVALLLLVLLVSLAVVVVATVVVVVLLLLARALPAVVAVEMEAAEAEVWGAEPVPAALLLALPARVLVGWGGTEAAAAWAGEAGGGAGPQHASLHTCEPRRMRHVACVLRQRPTVA